MSDFLLWSIVGSVVLTVLLNLLPVLFPRSAERAERRLHESLRDSLERDEGPRLRVFFPWKAMLVASLVLSVLVNLVGLLAGR